MYFNTTSTNPEYQFVSYYDLITPDQFDFIAHFFPKDPIGAKNYFKQLTKTTMFDENDEVVGAAPSEAVPEADVE